MPHYKTDGVTVKQLERYWQQIKKASKQVPKPKRTLAAKLRGKDKLPKGGRQVRQQANAAVTNYLAEQVAQHDSLIAAAKRNNDGGVGYRAALVAAIKACG